MSHTYRPRRILVAHGDAGVRRDLRGLLACIGHTDVLTVNNGRNALRLFQNDPTIDCVVAGTALPGLSGFSLMAAIRADPERGATTRVVGIIDPQKNRHSRLLALCGIPAISLNPARCLEPQDSRPIFEQA